MLSSTWNSFWDQIPPREAPFAGAFPYLTLNVSGRGCNNCFKEVVQCKTGFFWWHTSPPWWFEYSFLLLAPWTAAAAFFRWWWCGGRHCPGGLSVYAVASPWCSYRQCSCHADHVDEKMLPMSLEGEPFCTFLSVFSLSRKQYLFLASARTIHLAPLFRALYHTSLSTSPSGEDSIALRNFCSSKQASFDVYVSPHDVVKRTSLFSSHHEQPLQLWGRSSSSVDAVDAIVLEVYPVYAVAFFGAADSAHVMLLQYHKMPMPRVLKGPSALSYFCSLRHYPSTGCTSLSKLPSLKKFCFVTSHHQDVCNVLLLPTYTIDTNMAAELAREIIAQSRGGSKLAF